VTGALIVHWDGDEPEEVDESTFISANAHDEMVLSAVSALAPGESVEFGGGAAPLVRVTRPTAEVCGPCGGDGVDVDGGPCLDCDGAGMIGGVE
jgi:hypothetical protein